MEGALTALVPTLIAHMKVPQAERTVGETEVTGIRTCKCRGSMDLLTVR